MPASYPRIPYGWADFRAIRLENRLYVDKTRFVHALEEERYAFFIRPRRFGKSCWVSLLDNYYNRTRADDFEAVFDGTHLGRHPTENRHRYVVLRFNFSAFKNALETLEYHFEEYCQLIVRHALERNADLFPEAARQHIRSSDSVNGQLNELFLYAGDHGIPLYVLIDEYDNFANTVLAYHGEEAYQSFTHGGGFYRNFFATLKDGAGQSGGGLERMFITGVSPITMDDVTSGFNIGKNISLHPRVQRHARLHRGGGAQSAGNVPRLRRVRSGCRSRAGGDAGVVQRLSVRQECSRRPLQHRHGALFSR